MHSRINRRRATMERKIKGRPIAAHETKGEQGEKGGGGMLGSLANQRFSTLGLMRFFLLLVFLELLHLKLLEFKVEL